MTYTIKKSEDLSHDIESESENSYGEELLEQSENQNSSLKSKQSLGG